MGLSDVGEHKGYESTCVLPNQHSRYAPCMFWGAARSRRKCFAADIVQGAGSYWAPVR